MVIMLYSTKKYLKADLIIFIFLLTILFFWKTNFLKTSFLDYFKTYDNYVQKVQTYKIQIIRKLLDKQEGNTDMTSSDIGTVVQATKGFSGADVTNLCKEAALGPIRSIRVSHAIC